MIPQNSHLYAPSLTKLLSMVYVIENINDLTLAKNSYSSKNLIKEKTNRTRFSGLLTKFSPAEADGPALIYT